MTPSPVEQPTYCRICEPLCGLIATVEDGRLVRLRGDDENPLSQGFHCVKSAAMIDVVYDEDRVLTPLRRVGGPGEFEPVSWDEALSDIAARLGAIIADTGPQSTAAFFGNPPGFNYATLLWLNAFQRTIRSPWTYGVNGEDGASRLAASAILYGSATAVLKPDAWRSHFALILGANPLVSHGSAVTEPRIRDALGSIVERGGRVVVVDPRRTETARRYEHVPIRAGGDPHLLAALLNVVLSEGLADVAFLAAHADGLDDLRRLVAPFTPEAAEGKCGVPSAVIRDLARDLAAAPSAFVYGRTGTCTQRFGTLNNLLQDLLNIVTGNLERPGGWVFGWGPIDFSRFTRLAGMDTYGRTRSRNRDLPEILGMLPSQSLAEDIVNPGDGQIRSLILIGANPVHSSGAGRAIEQALPQLDLLVSLDLYVNETNRYADYILPVPTFLERGDLPVFWSSSMLRPTMFATDPVIDRLGDTREEWEVLDELARRLGHGGAYQIAPLRWLAKAGLRLTPPMVADALLRTSRAGDFFGLRPRGLSWAKLLERHPHGVQLRADLPTLPLRKRLRTPNRRVPLAPPELRSELARLLADRPDPAFPLRAHGMRELRSQNTWMHNAARLMPSGRRHTVLVNPADVGPGVTDGDPIRICSATGSITAPVTLTDDVAPGNVAVPHGWGHRGGWRRANAAGGANSNDLASGAAADVEAVAGMSILNGIPVRIES